MTTKLAARQRGRLHNHNVVFGRRVSGCPRCRELDLGAPTVKWRCDEVRIDRVREIRAHDCRKSGCGPVCTFGDW